MIDTAHDAVGVRTALEEIFEEEYVRSRIASEMAGANDQTRARMMAMVPVRTLSPGYYDWAQHLLRIDSMTKAGIVLQLGDVAVVEMIGLMAVQRARSIFEGNHPACPACKALQTNRFTTECHACGTKFIRKVQ